MPFESTPFVPVHEEGRVEQLAREAGARADGRHLLVLSDFDGTLSDFVMDPAKARIHPVAAIGLDAIARAPGVTAGFVSGRRLVDVRPRVPVPLPYETGLHGFEIEGPDVSFRHPALETAPPVVRRLHEEAARALAWCEGLLVEDKIYSLVCDVRLVPLSDAFRAVSQFRALVEADVRAGLLKLTVSAHAIELLPPADWHKGRAVDWIREHVAARLGRPPVVVYLGDDRTDADAFGALVDNDLAIGVGSLPAARGLAHRLPGPMAVGRFLSRLAALRANASPIQ